MMIIGIDLSGPGSEPETAVVRAQTTGGKLIYTESHSGTDYAILNLVVSVGKKGPVAVGLDAPLSYQPGGGQRDRDAELRRQAIAAGLPSGSVMAPTFQRMAWLTLRGIGLARVLGAAGCDLVEVHPGACMALRGAPIAEVLGFKRDEACRLPLLHWLAEKGFDGLPEEPGCTSHFVAACAAAYATYKWRLGESVWKISAEPPWHPYEFTC